MNPFCHYCGEQIKTIEEATLDHKQPRSRGGSHAAENTLLACQPCNAEKGDATYEEYTAWLWGPEFDKRVNL